MEYISTRGEATPVDFEAALLRGLAPDGGLFVPRAWPALPNDAFAGIAGAPYTDVANRVLAPFVDGAVDDTRLGELIADSYAGFDHPATAPLVQIDSNHWLLELFHGPTLAFKDFALQLLGRLFDDALARRGERATVVGATSGDTGSAAIHACAGRANIDIFILHPENRVSEVQRRQMTTVTAANVRNIAVRGTFDDCQALVKAMFNDTGFRDQLALSAVNSINWARIAAQVVYYVSAATALGGPGRPVAFSVPTGNFGDVFAGYVASRLGLPISRLIVATNRNDILARFFDTGAYRTSDVVATMSPSMDIQVSSNFERLLFDLYDHDGAAVRALMAGLDREGGFEVADRPLARARALFTGHRVDEAETLAEIGRVHGETGLLIDPHSAVGVAAARALAADHAAPVVTLATAHPAKFPEAVAKATGRRPEPPARLAHIFDAPERFDVLDRDLAALQRYIRKAMAGKI